MKINLRHAIKIDASRDRVFKALTNITEVSAWHYGPVEGEIAVGSVMYLKAAPDKQFSWETQKLVDNELIVQTYLAGPGQSATKTLTFALSDTSKGLTVVELTDGEWAYEDQHLPFCNTHWGGILYRLKQYVENKH